MAETAKWQMLAWAVAAALVVFAGIRMLSDRSVGPEAPQVRIDGEDRAGKGGQGSASGLSDGAGKAGLYVHVAGEVRRPGLFRVRDGARVAAAIERAGGATRAAELTAVNLAQQLEDGQQVIVPRRGARGAPAEGGGGTGGEGLAGEALPSLATATADQLEQLDGIGPALAQRIIDYRESHGGFRSVEELREVEGIGEKRFAALRDAVRP